MRKNLRSDNTTGYRGVTKIKKTNKYRAELAHKGERYRTKPFQSKKQAAKSYDRLKLAALGEGIDADKHLNFPNLLPLYKREISEIEKCVSCGEEKFLLDFPVDNSKSNGYGSWCKSCHSEYQKTKIKAGKNKQQQLPLQLNQPPKEKEMVDHPEHYNTSRLEVIDAIHGLGYSEGFCVGSIIKYVSRYKHKNGVEDLEKAKWYIEYLIKKEN